jgi:hypothetical protein
VVTFSVVFAFNLAEVQLVDILQVVMPFLVEQVVVLQSRVTFGVVLSVLSCLMDSTDELALLVEFAADMASITLAFSFCKKKK